MRKMKKFSEGGEVPDFSRLTFKEAFAAARKSPTDKGEFTWNGKRYNTELAAEAAKPKAKAKAKDLGPDESAAETSRLIRAAAAANKAEIDDKPLEESHPEMMIIGGPSLKTLHAGAKALAAKTGAKKVAEGFVKREPKLGDVSKMAAEKTAKREPTVGDVTKMAAEEGAKKEPTLGVIRQTPFKGDRTEPTFKRGGPVQSNASKRADGCAQRGKTRGRIY